MEKLKKESTKEKTSKGNKTMKMKERLVKVI